MVLSTDPEKYIIDLTGAVSATARQEKPSKRVLLALRAVCPQIETHGFRRKTLDAIFDDAVTACLVDVEYRRRYLRRLNLNVALDRPS